MIEKKVRELQEQSDGLNFHSETDCAMALTIARTRPCFANKQVVLLKVPDLKCDALLSYAKKPCVFTDMYIIPENVDKRTVIYKSLSNMGLIKEYGKLSQSQFKQFVLEKLLNAGKRISEEVYGYFVCRCGYFEAKSVTLFSIEKSVEQLCFVCEDDISKAAVDAFVEEGDTQKIFVITKDLLLKDRRKLLIHTNMLMRNGENGIAMLSLLLRNFRLAYKASLFADKPIKEISKMLGVPSYQFQEYLKFSPEQIEKVLDIFSEGIFNIKTGKMAAEIAVIISCQKAMMCL